LSFCLGEFHHQVFSHARLRAVQQAGARASPYGHRHAGATNSAERAANRTGLRLLASCVIGRTRIVRKMNADSAHPRFRPDASHPISEGGYAPEIFDDVLLGDQPDRHLPTGAIENCSSKPGFCRKAALCVVA